MQARPVVGTRKQLAGACTAPHHSGLRSACRREAARAEREERVTCCLFLALYSFVLTSLKEPLQRLEGPHNDLKGLMKSWRLFQGLPGPYRVPKVVLVARVQGLGGKKVDKKLSPRRSFGQARKTLGGTGFINIFLV